MLMIFICIHNQNIDDNKIEILIMTCTHYFLLNLRKNEAFTCDGDGVKA